MDPVSAQSIPTSAPIPQTALQQPVQQILQPQSTQQQGSKRGGFMAKAFLFIMGLVVLGSTAGGSYYLGMQKGKAMQSEEQKMMTKVTISKITLTPVPPSPTSDPTIGWQIYTNNKYMYSVKYPANLKATENNTYYHYVSFDTLGTHTLATFLISVVPDTFVANDIAAYNYMSSDWINSFYPLKVGDSKQASTGVTFIKLADTTFNGEVGSIVEVDTPTYKQHRVYIKKNGFIYMISNNYQNLEDLNSFATFLSTFKFTQ